MKEILISGGTIVNEGRRFRGWLLVRDGVIAEVGEGDFAGASSVSGSVSGSGAGEFRGASRDGGFFEDFRGEHIDAGGKIVMPGVIDPHVHFREPGLTAKGDMASESAAAVAGGVTSVLEMPNTVPQAVSTHILEQKFELAQGRMHTNYSFFLGATNDNLPEVKKFNFLGGVLVKLFTGSSTGNMLVDNERAIASLFAEFDGVIAAHCEDETIIRADTEFYRRRLGDSATAAIHPLVRSAEACYVATARAIELADKYGTRLHVCHVSTARELALFQAKNLLSKRITAEACVPHLWFSDEDYDRQTVDGTPLGNRIKCNPSIKSVADRGALREALGRRVEPASKAMGAGGSDAKIIFDDFGRFSGKIDLIATDHAPHTAEEKARGYWQAPSGIPMVQHSLAVMFELANQGVVSLETVVEKMCHAPAIRFGIAGRGFLRKGYMADIAIVDAAATGPDGQPGWVVSPENILYKCCWSPLEGTRLGARVVCTIVGGKVVWDGRRVAAAAVGEKLAFEK